MNPKPILSPEKHKELYDFAKKINDPFLVEYLCGMFCATSAIALRILSFSSIFKFLEKLFQSAECHWGSYC